MDRVASEQSSRDSSPERTIRSAPKGAELRKFSGKRGELQDFEIKLRTKLRLENSHYDTEEKKILMATSYFTGPAADWVRPMVRQYLMGQPRDLHVVRMFESLDAFMVFVTDQFGDQHELSQAERTLQTLQQKGSIQQYNSLFMQSAYKVQWDDRALVAAYKTGLSKDVRHALAIRGADASTFVAIKNAATEISGALYDAKRSTKGYPVYQHRTTANAGDPMDLDSLQKDRDQGKRSVKCFRCGKKGHKKAQCQQPEEEDIDALEEDIDQYLDDWRSDNEGLEYHSRLHWTACFDNTCLVHETSKEMGYTPKMTRNEKKAMEKREKANWIDEDMAAKEPFRWIPEEHRSSSTGEWPEAMTRWGTMPNYWKARPQAVFWVQEIHPSNRVEELLAVIIDQPSTITALTVTKNQLIMRGNKVHLILMSQGRTMSAMFEVMDDMTRDYITIDPKGLPEPVLGFSAFKPDERDFKGLPSVIKKTPETLEAIAYYNFFRKESRYTKWASGKDILEFDQAITFNTDVTQTQLFRHMEEQQKILWATEDTTQLGGPINFRGHFQEETSFKRLDRRFGDADEKRVENRSNVSGLEREATAGGLATTDAAWASEEAKRPADDVTTGEDARASEALSGSGRASFSGCSESVVIEKSGEVDIAWELASVSSWEDKPTSPMSPGPGRGTDDGRDDDEFINTGDEDLLDISAEYPGYFTTNLEQGRDTGPEESTY